MELASSYHNADQNQQYIERQDLIANGLIDQLHSGDFSVEKWIQELRLLLQDYPATRLIAFLRRTGSLDDFKSVIVTYCKDRFQTFLENNLSPNEEADFYERMEHDSRRWFFFAMMAIKDELTAQHCVETYEISSRTIPHISSMAHKDDAAKDLLLDTAIIHDHGKLLVASAALLNPFTWSQLDAIFMANLIDSKRRRPIPAPVPLSDEEELKFGPLLRGETHEVDLAREYYFKVYKPRGGDCRHIPLRFVLSVARHILNTDEFPAIVNQFFGQEDRVTPKIIDFLNRQKEALANVDAVFNLFGLDGWNTSFMQTLGLHEAGTAELLLQEGLGEVVNGVHHLLARVAGEHHGYSDSQARLPAALKAMSLQERERNVMYLLRILDVVAALAQTGRSYRDVNKPKTLDDVRNILGAESRSGKYPPELVDEFSGKMLRGPKDATDIIPILTENAAHLAGTFAEV